MIRKIELLLHKREHVHILGTGSAVYRAMKVYGLLKSSHKDSIDCNVNIKTIQVQDFLIPKRSGQKKEIANRNINEVDIEVFCI